MKNQAPKIHKLFGLYFAHNPWGNCFSPAVILGTNPNAKPFVSRINNPEGKLSYPAKATLTIRYRFMETTIYWRGGLRIDWNSAHLARKFGKRTEMDFGDVYQLTSRWLGNHIDL